MSSNGHGDSFEDREITTELAVLKIKVDHLKDDIDTRTDQQNALNEKLVEANQMMARAISAMEVNMEHQQSEITELKSSNSLQAKMLYAIATAALSTFVGLLSLLAKTFLIKG